MIAIYIIWMIYLLFVLVLIIVWNNIDEVETKCTFNNKFSIIVPIRNEEENIISLLEDLNRQTYPFLDFEVIVVNDHSTDNSRQKVIEASSQVKYSLKILDLSKDQVGKKVAISKGINNSQFNKIITTDGDCRVHKNWLASINSAYDNGVELVFGTVQYSPLKNMFQKLQALEFSALIVTGAVTHYLGLPGMCNGANFSFTKKVFNEVGGYSGNEKVPTGDDEFLLRKVRKKYPDGIRFIKNFDGTVKTSPQKNWFQFINQKIRWASKWKYHNDWATKILGIFVFGSNALILTSMVLSMMEAIPIQYFPWLLSAKILLEYILAMVVVKSSHKMSFVIPSILLSTIYPIYTIFIGLLSVKGKYSWKGRSC
ncbi:MAG: glycosyltransferase [Cyclobacteriaceae bacterium]|nr:glycosyltransferase [Cyclobacteriaceae bacterium]